jgi:hypothetical protein
MKLQLRQDNDTLVSEVSFPNSASVRISAVFPGTPAQTAQKFLKAMLRCIREQILEIRSHVVTVDERTSIETDFPEP